MDKATAEKMVQELLDAQNFMDYHAESAEESAEGRPRYELARNALIKAITTPKPQGEHWVVIEFPSAPGYNIDNRPLTWLYTHCLALGMKRKSDPPEGCPTAEFDIALFTADLLARAEKAEQAARVPPEAKPSTDIKDYGYQGGDYSGKCRDCGFRWDSQGKRSYRCYTCALEAMYLANKPKPLPVPEAPNKQAGPSWPIAWEELKKERDGHLWSAGDTFQYREFFRLGFMACIAWAPEDPEKLLNDRLLEAAKAVAKWHESPIALESDGVMYEMREAIEAIEKGEG